MDGTEIERWEGDVPIYSITASLFPMRFPGGSHLPLPSLSLSLSLSLPPSLSVSPSFFPFLTLLVVSHIYIIYIYQRKIQKRWGSSGLSPLSLSLSRCLTGVITSPTVQLGWKEGGRGREGWGVK